MDLAVETMDKRFFNLYSHDFVRVAVAMPRCRVADPAFNAQETIRLARQAADEGAVLVAFPELGLSAYTCDDLFHQRALLDACEAALGRGRRGVRDAAGAGRRRPAAARRPRAVQLRRGRLRRPRSSAWCRRPTCRTTASSTRRASSAPATPRSRDRIAPAAASDVPFGSRPAVRGSTSQPLLTLPRRDLRGRLGADPAVVATPRWPARRCCVNLSASNITIGKSDYRHQLVSQQSARCLAAYLYSSAGLRRVDHRPRPGTARR